MSPEKGPILEGNCIKLQEGTYFFGTVSREDSGGTPKKRYHGKWGFWIGGSLNSPTWNSKQPFINGCFNWMIPNLYIGNGCFTKHPIKNCCLEYQVNTFSAFEE